MRTNLGVVAAIVVSVMAGSACASKGFVRTQVGDVNTKVNTLGTSLEATQERTRQNEARIGEVDTKADAAGKSAQDARQAANVADEKAVSAAKKADAVEAATRRLVYEVVLSEDQGNFKFGKAELPEEAKARIDEMVNQLKADPKAIYIEIEGHTDSVGTNHMNDTLGLERAEAVKRYLYEAHQVPLHKMNAISFGEEKPVAPNNTKQGRAQNRRVVIKVLA